MNPVKSYEGQNERLASFSRIRSLCMSIIGPPRRYIENNRLVIHGLTFPSTYTYSKEDGSERLTSQMRNVVFPNERQRRVCRAGMTLLRLIWPSEFEYPQFRLSRTSTTHYRLQYPHTERVGSSVLSWCPYIIVRISGLKQFAYR